MLDALSNTNTLEAKLLSDELFNTLVTIEEMAKNDGVIIDGTLKFSVSRKSDLKNEALLLEISTQQFFDRFKPSISWLLRKLFLFLSDDSYATASGYVTFFLLMLSKIETLATKVLEHYRQDQNAVVAIHLMMDMQYPFNNDQPVIEFAEQIEITSNAILNFNRNNRKGQKILGFVAFDPNRDDEQGANYVAIGLAKGNVGVKLYPPMGYTGYGHFQPEQPDTPGTPPNVDIPPDPNFQRRLFKLYEECINSDRPLLAHCTPEGFQAYKESGLLSHPVYWELVLKKYKKLRFCYGHAGGIGKNSNFPGWGYRDADWASPNNYARLVVEHCREYENVYCDVSHYESIMKDDHFREVFVENFIRELLDDSGKCKFRDKVMYGSDWHMPEMAQRCAQYLDFFRELFSDNRISGFADNFFYKNAMKFLKLETRSSVQSLLRVGPLSTPADVEGTILYTKKKRT